MSSKISKSLRHVEDASFNITRRKSGRGFAFYDLDGEKINDKKMLKRLKSLVIPPMWTEVLICQWEDGHVQATGRDSKGRKQYIYHSEWERQRQNEKFKKMYLFGNQLPEIRRRCYQDIKSKNWDKEKVLALMVLILDETGIRIGNQRYTQENNTHGLSTLRRKHMSIESNELLLNFTGKSGKDREVSIEDEELIKYVKKSAEQPGHELFRYKNTDGTWNNISSEDVNEYIKSISSKEFFCKDFRTWAATRLAVEYYPDALKEKENNPRKKMTNILIRFVADELGNTPSICRDYYIHPYIMGLINDKKIPEITQINNTGDENACALSAEEQTILSLLNQIK